MEPINQTAVAKELFKIASLIVAEDVEDKAWGLITGSEPILKRLVDQAKELEEDFARVRKEVKGLESMGSERISAPDLLEGPMKSALRLQDFVNMMVAEMKKGIKR